MNYIKKTNFYIIFGSILLFILGAVYFKGLYFDKNVYIVEIIFSLLFLMYLFFNKKDLIGLFAKSYIWLILGVAFLYLINVPFTPNKLLALNQSFRWILAVQIFILVLAIKDKKYASDIIWFAFVIVGVWTSIFGWLGAYRLVDFQDAFMEHSNRFTSVFQYSNTFAVFLGAVLIGVLIRGTSQKWVYSIASITSYMLTLTVILTYSRGTWIALVIVWLLVLFFLPLKKQFLYIIHFLLIGIAIIFTFNSVNDSIANGLYGQGFLIITVTSLIVGILYIGMTFLFNKVNFPNRIKNFRWVVSVVAVLLVILGIYLITIPSIVEKLPDTLEARVKDINFDTYSVQERSYFYNDSKELIKEGLLFGNGGGVWEDQYWKYKSYPYISSQVHNFYFQLIIEIGIVGLILFIGFLVLILLSIIKSRNNFEEDDYNRKLSYGFMVLLILLHSFIDFNMSYMYILGITMVLLALFEEPINYPIHSKDSKRKSLAFLSIVLVIILSIISLLYAIRFLYAFNLAKELTNMPVSETEKRINKAVALNPYELDYRFEKIKVYQFLFNETNNDEYKQEFIKETVYIRDSNPIHPEKIIRLSSTLADMNYIGESVKVLENAINNEPWVKELYEPYFVYSFNLAENYQKNGQEQEAEQLLNKILYYYSDLLNGRELLDKQPLAMQYKSFDSTAKMELYVGATYVVLGKYDEGFGYLIPLTNSKNQNIKKYAVMWTVYAYEQLGNKEKVDEYMHKGKNLNIVELKKVTDIWE